MFLKYKTMQKYSIRRLQPSIQKFLNVVEIDLNRLSRHKNNFEKFNRLHDWDNLNRELINASRTLQQIKSNIIEIDKTREQIVESDVKLFDDQIECVKQKALFSVNEFLEIYTYLESRDCSTAINSKINNQEQRPLHSYELPDPLENDEVKTVLLSDCDELILSDSRLRLTTVPDDTEAFESLEKLRQDLFDLNDLLRDFSSVVHANQETIDRIEGNIDHALEDVNRGVKNLGVASKLKRVAIPLAGAVIGGVVGGPIGLVAGIKIGAASAVGGSLIGLAGATVIKRYEDRKVDVELQEIKNSHKLLMND